jgi:hypothetical protein
LLLTYKFIILAKLNTIKPIMSALSLTTQFMKLKNQPLVVLVSLLLASCGGGTSNTESSAVADSTTTEMTTQVPESNYPVKVLWGDTHLHSSWSADAGSGGTTVGPEETIRFAMGESIKSSGGQMAKLGRPLDWVALTDHSDGMGLITGIIGGDPELMEDPILKKWHEDITSGDPARATSASMDMINRQSSGTLPAAAMDPKYAQTVWEKSNAIIEKYYKPGQFTTLIAYEWTSNYGGGNNLHRNVFYRGGAKEANQVTPYTTFVSEDPEDLWKWMDAYEKKTGGKLLAIPHNGNLSNGLMFAQTTLSGKPLTKEYATERQKWEVLYEVTQGKGTSETHPSLSPTDEFANFEIWDKGNLVLQPKKPGDIGMEYIREGLKSGLKLEQELGVNPFKYGIVAGTDAHTGLTGIEEDNYWGKYKTEEPGPDRWNKNALSFNGRVVKGWELGATGWTGVWATANTREAIWDAMKRKETYGTTGPRMTVRFFGGYDFSAADLGNANWAEVAYGKGVPMGGDLAAAPAGRAPSFLVMAVKDPIGANLDRVQIIKGWVDANGNKQEKIYDVVWGDADKRKPDAKGKLPVVGNTVNLETATVDNSIGDPELNTVWSDPDFNAALPAFYYVRVLEIPTPRWTAYDVVRFNVKMSKEVPMILQERAYTSPIWYTPKK